MAGRLIPNPPSHETVASVLLTTAKERKLDITERVRDAVIDLASVNEHYLKMTTFLRGGEITGNKIADAYKLAEFIVEEQAQHGDVALKVALDKGDIQLNAIVKRLPGILKKHLKMDIQSWVCVGTLAAPESAKTENVVAL